MCTCCVPLGQVPSPSDPLRVPYTQKPRTAAAGVGWVGLVGLQSPSARPPRTPRAASDL